MAKKFAKPHAASRGAEEKGWQRQMMSTCWHPNLKVLNEIELKRKEIWYRVAPPSTIVYCYRALGVYHESFELEAFPFDCQNRRANPGGAMVFVVWVYSRDLTGCWACSCSYISVGAKMNLQDSAWLSIFADGACFTGSSRGAAQARTSR